MKLKMRFRKLRLRREANQAGKAGFFHSEEAVGLAHSSTRDNFEENNTLAQLNSVLTMGDSLLDWYYEVSVMRMCELLSSTVVAEFGRLLRGLEA